MWVALLKTAGVGVLKWIVKSYLKAEVIISFLLCKTRERVIRTETKTDDYIWNRGHDTAEKSGEKVPCKKIVIEEKENE
jgi:hypothetical protein